MSKPKTTIDLVGDEWKLSVDEICARYGTNATTVSNDVIYIS